MGLMKKSRIIVGVLVLGGLIVLSLLIGAMVLSTNVQSEKELLVGAVLPLTGPASWFGSSQKEAIMLAEEKINANGGVNGTQMRILFEDSESDATKGLSAFNSLKSQGVKTSIVALSKVSNAVIAADANQSTLIFTAVSLPGITKKSDSAFRFYPASTAEALHMSDYMLSKGITSVVVLYSNDEFGVGAKNAFREQFTQKGIIPYEDSFALTDTDFKSIIAKVKEVPTQGIYVLGYTAAVPALMKQLRENEVTVQLFSAMPVASPDFIKASNGAMEGTYFTASLFDPDANTVLVQEFVSAYQSKFNKKPDAFAAFAFDATMAIATAARANGTSEAQIRDGLKEMKTFNGVLGTTTISSDGSIEYPLRVVRLKNGILQAV